LRGILCSVKSIQGKSKGTPVSLVEWERRLLAMHGATDTEEFLQAVFDLLDATVVCDFSLANLRNVDSVPLVARDSLGREYGVEYMERHFKLNPAVSYVMKRPGLRLLHTRDHLPEGEKLKEMPFYREMMKPMGWRHSVALLFWGFFPPIPQNSFCVFRNEGEPDFDADDLARLRLVHPHIATALKRFKKQLKARSAEDRIAALLDSLPGNATLLEWDLRITNQSATARRLIALWAGREHESLPRAFELPAEVLAVCAEMKKEWLTALRANPQARMLNKRTVAHSSLVDLSAEITLVLQQDSMLAHPGFLVNLVEASAMKGGAGLEFSALSPSERDAALLAAEGLSNEEIARRLGVSVAAVKLRLHGTFKKLNIRSRSQLAAMLR
jgi:DNA-binding NarL/FixJ family response regulator